MTTVSVGMLVLAYSSADYSRIIADFLGNLAFTKCFEVELHTEILEYKNERHTAIYRDSLTCSGNVQLKEHRAAEATTGDKCVLTRTETAGLASETKL